MNLPHSGLGRVFLRPFTTSSLTDGAGRFRPMILQMQFIATTNIHQQLIDTSFEKGPFWIFQPSMFRGFVY